jgi:hypothetical protein
MAINSIITLWLVTDRRILLTLYPYYGLMLPASCQSNTINNVFNLRNVFVINFYFTHHKLDIYFGYHKLDIYIVYHTLEY